MTTPFKTDLIKWEETILGGAHWSGMIRRGTGLRLTDLSGGANLGVLLFNAEEKLERYNMPDTLKSQHTAFLTKGNVCHSDMGRTMISVIEDDLGWHDTLCGLTDNQMIAKKYGDTHFQTHRNARFQNAKDGLLIELAKYGLGKRDLHANINFFSKVMPDKQGKLHFVARHSQAASYVDLRFDMNVLMIASAAPHPLDTNSTYQPSSVKLTAWQAGLASKEDACRQHCEQNERAFINTERYYG